MGRIADLDHDLQPLVLVLYHDLGRTSLNVDPQRGAAAVEPLAVPVRLVAGPGVPALRAPGLSEVHRHRCDPSAGDPQASTCELRNKGRHCESECPCLTRALLRPWCLPGFSYRCSTGGSSRLRPTLRPPGTSGISSGSSAISKTFGSIATANQCNQQSFFLYERTIACFSKGAASSIFNSEIAASSSPRRILPIAFRRSMHRQRS